MKLKRSSWLRPSKTYRGLHSIHEAEIKLPGSFQKMYAGTSFTALLELPTFMPRDKVKTLSPATEFLDNFLKDTSKRWGSPPTPQHWLSTEIAQALSFVNSSGINAQRRVSYGDFKEFRPWVWQFVPNFSHEDPRTIKDVVKWALPGGTDHAKGLKVVGYDDGLGGTRAYYGAVHSLAADKSSFVMKTDAGYRRFLFSKTRWFTSLFNVSGFSEAVLIELVGTGNGKAVLRIARVRGELPKTPQTLSELLPMSFKHRGERLVLPYFSKATG